MKVHTKSNSKTGGKYATYMSREHKRIVVDIFKSQQSGAAIQEGTVKRMKKHLPRGIR